MNIEDAVKDQRIQFLIVFLTFLVYIITKNALLGVVLAIEIVGLVILEFKQGAESHGVKQELKETLEAVVAAVLLILILSFLLGTSTPLSAVASCSMNPALHRGDLVVIHHVSATALGVPLLHISHEQLEALNSTKVKVFENHSFLMEVNGSLFNYCVLHHEAKVCGRFFNNPTAFYEKRGNFTFLYADCLRGVKQGDKLVGVKEPCMVGVLFQNKTTKKLIPFDDKGTVVVYQPPKSSLFARVGDIVHRAVFVVSSGGKEYVITKGDNNNIPDIGFYMKKKGNYVVPFNNVRGGVWFSVPYIGYLKLVLFGYVTENKICQTNLYVLKQ